ncbi:MAG: class I SAM-dependent methyltransferase [Bacteroidota bacterium]
MVKIGSREWNNEMFLAHPTPYEGLAGWIEKQRLQFIIKEIKKHIGPRPGQILELGCESGHLLASLHQAFPHSHLYGIDISDVALKQAKRRLAGSNCQFLQADICEEIPFEEEVDIIICSETLEHIPDTDLALREIKGILKEEQILILSVPLEKLKNTVKNVLGKIGLMPILFPKIEEGFSSWHVQDFSPANFQNKVSEYFDIISYSQLLGLHQLIVAKKKTL